MRTSLQDAHRAHPLTLFAVLCLRWPGSLIFLAGWLVLARDVVAWSRQGSRLDLAVTGSSAILSPFLSVITPPEWDEYSRRALEFFRIAPLSLFLLMMGWCLRQLAQNLKTFTYSRGRAG